MTNKITKMSQVEFGGFRHRVTDLTHDILKGEVFDNTAQLPQHSQDIPRPGVKWAEMGFGYQLAGNGAAGTAPPMAALLNGCAMKETISVGVSVEYSTANHFDTDLTAASLAAYKGNLIKEECLTAVGDMSMILEPGKPCDMKFDFSGLYTPQTTATGTGVLVTTARPPVCLGMTLTIGGVAVIVRKLELGLMNENNSPRKDAIQTYGCLQPNIIGYDPFVKALIEYPDQATKDYVAEFLAETKVALNAVLGSVAGNIITIDGDLYQKAHPVTGDDEGIMSQELEFARSFQTGDTPLKLTFT